MVKRMTCLLCTFQFASSLKLLAPHLLLPLENTKLAKLTKPENCGVLRFEKSYAEIERSKLVSRIINTCVVHFSPGGGGGGGGSVLSQLSFNMCKCDIAT